MTALPGRRWRVYLRPSSAESDLVADAASTIHRYAPAASFADVENPTRFHCHTKVATKFRSGAVFLAGDAAHLCSPAEGHGMNCGLQDAFNLAWKLALVYQGAAEPALLDSYEAERRPVAEMVTQSGDDTEHALTMTDPAERDTRDQAIRAMLAEPKARHHEVVAETELNVDYSRSPIVSGDVNSHLAPGQRLPDTIPVADRTGSPADFTNSPTAPATPCAPRRPNRRGPALADLLAAVQKLATDSPLFEAAIAFGTRPDLPNHRTPRIAAADLLGVQGTTVLAVRPDGYIGLRSDRDHLSALERYGAIVHSGRA